MNREYIISPASRDLIKSLNHTAMFYESGVPYVFPQRELGKPLQFKSSGILKAKAHLNIEPGDPSFQVENKVEMAVVSLEEGEFTIHAALRIDNHLYTFPLDLFELADFRT